MSDPLSDVLLDAAYAKADGSGQLYFPARELHYDAGHDGPSLTAFGRDGAVHQPTGRRAYKGSLEIVLAQVPALVARYGSLFPDRYRALEALLKTTPVGQMVHPLLGNLSVFVRSWNVRATPEDRAGVVLTLDWEEDRATVSDVLDVSRAEVESGDGVSSRAATADAAVASARTSTDPTANSLSRATTSELPTLTASPSASPSALTASFGRLLTTCDEVLANPALARASGATALLEVERYRASVLRLRDRLLPTPRTYTTPVEMSAAEVALAAYGSLDSLAGLLAANALPDSSRIPAGTVLQLPAL